MPAYFYSFPFQVLLVTLVAATLRLLLLWPMGLNDDEAYYWMWSHMPSLSYFDHTPGAGLFLVPVVKLFGDQVLTLRVLSCLTGVSTAVVITLVARSINPELSQRQWITILWVSSICGFVLLANLVWTPDALLLLFFTLGIWQLDRALTEGTPGAWLWTGACFALAMLSKANAGPYIALIGLWMLAHPKGRSHLHSPWPWISFVIVLSSLLPVLIWNLNHDWAFFRFQGVHIFAPDGSTGTTDQAASVNWREIAIFLVVYPVVAGPAVVAAIMQGKVIFQNDDRSASKHLLLSVALVATCFFAVIASYKSLPAHWAIVSILMLYILGIAQMVQWRKRWIVLQWLACIPVLVLIVAMNHFPPTVSLSKNWRNGLVWDQVYTIMLQEHKKLPVGTLMAGLKYQDASQLAFYERWRWSELPGGHAVPSLNLSGRSNHYAHVWSNDSYKNANFLVLSKKATNRLDNHFCRVRFLGEHDVFYLGKKIRTIFLYYGENFAGRPDLGFGNIDSASCIDTIQ